MRKLTALTVALSLSAAGQAFAGPPHAPAAHAPTAHAPAAHPQAKAEAHATASQGAPTKTATPSARKVAATTGGKDVSDAAKINSGTDAPAALVNSQQQQATVSTETVVTNTNMDTAQEELSLKQTQEALEVTERASQAKMHLQSGLDDAAGLFIANHLVSAEAKAEAPSAANDAKVEQARPAVAQELSAEARDNVSLAGVGEDITGGSYIAGLAFAIGAVEKFKQHKDNPTQITIGTPVALVAVAAALLFLPSVLSVEGYTVVGTAEATDVPGVTISAE
jgi:hypothetical protein